MESSHPYLSELDIKLSLKNHKSSKTTRGGKQVDLLDEIEACLIKDISDTELMNADQFDYESDCFSHTDLDSLTSVSSSSGSLRSSGEFEFDRQLSSLSNMANQMSPFFSKLKDISDNLSKSTQELSGTTTLGREESITTSTSSITWAPSRLTPSHSSSDLESVFSGQPSNQQTDTWSGRDSPTSSQGTSSICSLTASPCEETGSLSGVSFSEETDGKKTQSKRPCSLYGRRDSYASDRSSPLLSRDVFSPVNTHRVSVMSLMSAFSYLAEKGCLCLVSMR